LEKRIFEVRTRKNVVEFGDSRLDTKINRLVAEINDEASEYTGVNLRVLNEYIKREHKIQA
jgi:ATP-dependent protease HslVU (ClpYQ) ATPase subunit